MNHPTRHAVTAALMAGFFMVANGLALAWTLTNDGPYMRHGFVIVLIGISASLFPVLMWGQFKLPRLALQVVVAATTLREAMRKATHWRGMGRPGVSPVVVSVNLSARQMAERDLVASVG